jgi:hypothetical protein
MLGLLAVGHACIVLDRCSQQLSSHRSQAANGGVDADGTSLA